MKRAKRIYALLGVLAVICVITFLVVRREEEQENIRNSGEVVLEVDADSVKSISWETETESLSFHKEDSWLYDDDEAFPVNEEKINELIGQFEEFSASFIIEEVSDYSQYGLDDPELTVTVVYTPEEEDGSEEEKQTFTISISRDPEEREKAENSSEESESDEEEEITAYARVGDSKIIYKITSSSYEALMAAGYDDLRHSEVFTASFDDVTSMDISLEGSDYTITSEGTGDKKTFYYNEEEISIDDFQSALEDTNASSFTDESPSQKEEISLTLYLDNEVHTQVQIELYRYDGEHCLAVIDGESVSLVPRSDVVDLIEAVNTLVL